ncbi:type II toxin-antitoxin system HipA family toxin [Sphingobacterium sp. SGL-16]|uniref:type II toxin-antitoxin system HipA family toxin n=1 Tax=Sphingobacterium sp. SGL-16 TaxID=2710883 RepID=UPI0013EBD29C|nr:type II toxin-antitoxin system HipA family toxin [Sphingobacterium sp. SGL-16]NGM71665.1 type II toxin-antitoxin system HipA family toxin [Sphingobacterium sp. SGL-16]
MAKNSIIKVSLFNVEIGTLGYDKENDISYFQYNPEYLKRDDLKNIFPIRNIIRPIDKVQVFKNFKGETFRSLPPFIADSLPDMFGKIIFREWLEANNQDLKDVTVLEQLAYVADRGMGGLEYSPAKEIPKGTTIDISEIVEVVKQVVDVKGSLQGQKLDHASLLNVFKIGSSAGGARPKILISQHKESGKIIAGDVTCSADYKHYLVKLDLDEVGYSRETIEYCYYLTARHLGLTMMDSLLIEGKHFATERFDRVNGQKRHVRTVSGLTGWDFKSLDKSSYENVFDLAIYLKIPHKQLEELFSRMVFNVVFHNTDDHLKNHSFMYMQETDSWELSPFYDVTYSLNPLINYTNSKRALSIGGKRSSIGISDVLKFADKYTIKGAKGIVEKMNEGISYWNDVALKHNVPDKILNRIVKDFNPVK